VVYDEHVDINDEVKFFVNNSEYVGQAKDMGNGM